MSSTPGGNRARLNPSSSGGPDASRVAPFNPADRSVQGLTQALEGMRQRLTTLATSLDEYGKLIMHPQYQPFPPYSVLQTRASTVATHMAAVTEHLARHHTVFAQANIFPNLQYPTAAPMGLPVLGELLRNKPGPAVEDWLISEKAVGDTWCRGIELEQVEVEVEGKKDEKGEQVKEHIWQQTEATEEERTKPTFQEWNKFLGGVPKDIHNYTTWIQGWLGAHMESRRVMQGFGQELHFVDYTRAEREAGIENVNTGLQRELNESAEEAVTPGSEDADESDDDTPSQSRIAAAPPSEPTRDINAYLRYVNIGIMPEATVQANG